MKKLFILKTLVDIVWVMAIAICIATLIVLLYFSLSKGNLYYLEGLDNLKGKTGEILNITIVYSIFMVIIYKFKQIIEDFFRKKLFTEKVIRNLNQIGYLLISLTVIESIVRFIFNLKKGKLELLLSNSFLSYLILGLFFIVLSEIFTISKAQKEENELTI